MTFHFTKWQHVRNLCFVLVFSMSSSPVWACQGKDYTETMRIVQESLAIGYDVAMTGNVQNLMSNIERLNRRLFALPQTCQTLFQQISANFKNRYNPNATNCIGGVCCDATSCY